MRKYKKLKNTCKAQVWRGADSLQCAGMWRGVAKKCAVPGLEQRILV